MCTRTRADTPHSPNANFLQVGDGRPSLQALSHHPPPNRLPDWHRLKVDLFGKLHKAGNSPTCSSKALQEVDSLGLSPLVELGGALWCSRHVPKTGLLPRIRLACAPPTTLCLLSPPIISHNTTTSTTSTNHYHHHRSPSPLSPSRSVTVSLGCRLTCLHN